MEQRTLGKWQLLAGIMAVIIAILFGEYAFSLKLVPFSFHVNLDGLGTLILGIAMILTGYYNLKAKRKR